MSEHWWRDALCPEIGIDLFFLEDGEPGLEAKAACAMCPVRVECLADACLTPISHGIFGGFGRATRDQITARIQAGALPMTIAAQAIDNEKKRNNARAQARTAQRHPDRRRPDLAVHDGQRREGQRPRPAAHGLRAAG